MKKYQLRSWYLDHLDNQYPALNVPEESDYTSQFSDAAPHSFILLCKRALGDRRINKNELFLEDDWTPDDPARTIWIEPAGEQSLRAEMQHSENRRPTVQPVQDEPDQREEIAQADEPDHWEGMAQADEDRKNLTLEIEQLNRTISRQNRKIEALEDKLERASLSQRLLENIAQVKFVTGK